VGHYIVDNSCKALGLNEHAIGCRECCHFASPALEKPKLTWHMSEWQSALSKKATT